MSQMTIVHPDGRSWTFDATKMWSIPLSWTVTEYRVDAEANPIDHVKRNASPLVATVVINYTPRGEDDQPTGFARVQAGIDFLRSCAGVPLSVDLDRQGLTGPWVLQQATAPVTREGRVMVDLSFREWRVLRLRTDERVEVVAPDPTSPEYQSSTDRGTQGTEDVTEKSWYAAGYDLLTNWGTSDASP